MTTFRPGWVAPAFLFVLAPVASACSAGSAVDLARNSRDTDSYRSARDVAKEVLDAEGIATDVSRDVQDAHESDEKLRQDVTTLEAATGSLLSDRYGYSAGAGIRDLSTFETIGDSMTQADWRKMLDTRSDHANTNHAMNLVDQGVRLTVRDHLLWHAADILSAMKSVGETPQLLRDKYASGLPAQPAPVAPPPAPAPVITAPAGPPPPSPTPAMPRPAPVPVPVVDHAG